MASESTDHSSTEDLTAESLSSLKKLAQDLGIPGVEGMNREEILYAIHKAQGADGGLSI